jgi:hypothetical protein
MPSSLEIGVEEVSAVDRTRPISTVGEFVVPEINPGPPVRKL